VNSVKFHIGVDGGGTKTQAVIIDAQGTVLAQHIAGATNIQIVGCERASELIFSLIEKCRRSVRCGYQQIDTIGCGLAGVGRPLDQRRMRTALRSYAASKGVRLNKIVIESDARAALEGAFRGGSGIILIAGTGSIAFAKDCSGGIVRAGGWGRYLDDEGSGYFIGKKAIRALAHVIDKTGPATQLVESLAESFGLKDHATIIESIYRKNFDIASVAPLVLRGAENKDPVCLAIIEEAALALCGYVSVLAQKIGGRGKGGEIPLVLIGGLIAHDSVLAKAVSKYITENIRRVAIVEPAGTPAQGAALLAMLHKETRAS